MPKNGQTLVTKEEREIMVEMFLEGYEICEISERVGRNRETIYRNLKKAEVSLESGKEARERKRERDGAKRKYTVTARVMEHHKSMSKNPSVSKNSNNHNAHKGVDPYELYRKNALGLEGSKKIACDYGENRIPDSEPVNCNREMCKKCYYGEADKNKRFPCCHYALIEHKCRSLQGISAKACTKFRTNAQVREWKKERERE